MYLWYP